MRHQNAGRKFDRNTSHRRAMFRNLAANLIAHERIETTEAKAKELRRVVEKLLSKAIRLGKVAYDHPKDLTPAEKAQRLHAERIVASFLPRFLVTEDGGKPVDLVQKVFLDLAKFFQGRPGGYTRTIKLGNRRGDNAPMVYIELTGRINPVAKPAPKAESSTSGEATAAPATPAEPAAEAPKAEAPKAEAPAAAT